MEEKRDAFLTKEIGRSMRFFLNVSCLFIVILFLLSIPRPLTPRGPDDSPYPGYRRGWPFFLAFLRLLKNIESDAAKHRDIELTTRVIGEFNKSWIIRAAIGRIPTFKIEKKPE